MTKSILTGFLALCVGLLGAASSRAAELGDKAPELKILEWAKGEPITLPAIQEAKKVAVVEFWATWCPPCRASIPHITKLQQKYKDSAVFIGVSSESAETVKSFVEKQGDNMNYRVAIDSENGTTKGFMGAFGIQAIPHAFLVDQTGRIIYHAHPMDTKLEDYLEKAVSGEFDLAAAKKAIENEQNRERLFEEYGELVIDGKDKEKAKSVGQQLYEVLSEDATQLGQLAWAIASAPELGFQDLDFALQCAKKAVDLTERKSADLLDTYARVLYESGDKEEAIKTAEQALPLAEDEKMKEHIESQIQMYKGEPDPPSEDEGEEGAAPPPVE